METLRCLGWVIGNLITVVLLSAYGFTHHLSMLGTIMSVVVGFVIISVLSLLFFARTLINPIRFIAAPFIAVIVAVVTLTGGFGTLVLSLDLQHSPTVYEVK